ncbi:phosphohistidine phosphatase SixA [Hahella ganghwensis]|uniref:phosphohistidine phosphatase SixA n=1 Tax=Hahella ganghwensis TaxID=286420 RepID=UPI00035E1D26|nr:phosphohistidine phosphatase SixA [Hahella ganghwensis]
MSHIFIMRHGEAEMHAASDSERELTPYGLAYTKQVAQQLADYLEKLEVNSLVVLHSPFTRARQTAEVLDALLPVSQKLIRLEFATPDDDPSACFENLEQYASHNFILVSHMPLVSSLGSLLEHGNLYHGQGFHTSEIRAYSSDVWGAGCGQFIGRLY